MFVIYENYSTINKYVKVLYVKLRCCTKGLFLMISKYLIFLKGWQIDQKKLLLFGHSCHPSTS